MVPDTNFHEAIDTKRKISFCYTDYDINKKRKPSFMSTTH